MTQLSGPGRETTHSVGSTRPGASDDETTPALEGQIQLYTEHTLLSPGTITNFTVTGKTRLVGTTAMASFPVLFVFWDIMRRDTFVLTEALCFQSLIK